MPLKKEEQYVPDESDSTKSRRLAEDYDSTKNGMDYGKYQGTRTYHPPILPLSLSLRTGIMLRTVTGRPPGRHFKKRVGADSMRM